MFMGLSAIATSVVILAVCVVEEAMALVMAMVILWLQLEQL